MPIYEYICQSCKSRFTTLVRGFTGPGKASCPRCGSEDTRPAISTFAYHKSIQTIHEESGEPSIHSGTDFYKDPRNIGRYTEKKFKEMGMDVPPEIKESIDAARDGVLPKELTE